jgi:hypothetical protein
MGGYGSDSSRLERLRVETACANVQRQEGKLQGLRRKPGDLMGFNGILW